MKLLMLDPVLADAEGATTGAQRLAKADTSLGVKGQSVGLVQHFEGHTAAWREGDRWL